MYIVGGAKTYGFYVGFTDYVVGLPAECALARTAWLPLHL